MDDGAAPLTRRTFMAGALGAAGIARGAAAQPASRVWRIGYLSRTTPEFDGVWVSALRDGLRALGYVDGHNAEIAVRHAEGHDERLRDLAADLVRRKADVVVVYGAPTAVQAVRRVSRTMPIVMTVATDPVGDGIVTSLARPGGNVTGLSDLHTEAVPKRLDLLREVVPSLSHVAVVLNPSYPAASRQFKHLQSLAAPLRLTMTPLAVRGPDATDIDHAFAPLAKERAEGLMILPDPMFNSHQARIAALSIKHKLPAIGTQRSWADAGALLAYGTNFGELWRRAATYVDKILQGAKPADLPIEQATKFDLVVNLRTAKQLGLTIAPATLLRADQVIE